MELPVGVEYAGFWRRVLASMIDTILMGILIAIIFSTLSATGMAMAFGYAAFPGFFDLLFLVIIVMLWLKYGATPGKMMLDCRIVDSRTGKDLGVGQSIIRYFGYLLSTIPFCLGFIWVAFSERKQGFHDLIAHTVVIHSPNHVEKDNEAEKSIDTLSREF